MKQLITEKWLRPIACNPKTTISALGAIGILFAPHHSARIAAAVAAVGLLFAGDAKQC